MGTVAGGRGAVLRFSGFELDAERLCRVEEPLDVRLELEDPSVIDPDALPHAVT